MTVAVYLINEWEQDGKPRRRRRLLGRGKKVTILPVEGIAEGGDPEAALPTLVVDGIPLAYSNPYDPCRWETTDASRLPDTGAARIDIVQEST